MNRKFTVCVSFIALLGGVSSLGLAQQAAPTGPLPLQTSFNALMVYFVDPAAHEIWNRGYKDKMADEDWRAAEQHAVNLAASTSLLTMKGTGPMDEAWVNNPLWRSWAKDLQDSAHLASLAAHNKDQQGLAKAGDVILDTCEGCHKQFKPLLPTEGIKHLPQAPF